MLLAIYIVAFTSVFFVYPSNTKFGQALILVVGGNLIIGLVIQWLHGIYQTKRYTNENNEINWDDFALKNITGLVEAVFYVLLLANGAETLLAGALIVKTVGNFWAQHGENQDNDISNKESRIIAIFRLGFVLHLLLVIFSAILLHDASINVFGIFKTLFE